MSTDAPAPSPAEAYQARLRRHRAAIAAAERYDGRISLARLVLFALAALVGWLALGRGLVSAWWLLAPVAGFAALVAVHAWLRRRRRRAQRAAAYYERALARLEGRWAGTGRTGARFLDPHHPYADDLDLFGEGSLYELLCAARTSMGEETLARWLLQPEEPAAIRERQAAVRELAPRLDLREDLAVQGDDVSGAVHADALVALGRTPRRPPDRRLRAGLAALTVATATALAAWGLGWVNLVPALVLLAVQSVVAWLLRGRVREAERAVAGHGPDLALLAAALARFEREPFASPLLARLRREMETGGVPPSRAVRSLRLRVDLLDSRRNQFFAPIAQVLMWGTHCALAVEAWRARHGDAVERWLGAIGELEALASLAGYAFEHPADVDAEIDEGGARFEAEALGHPLIPEDRCVRNDVALGGEGPRVLIVSGSNMSGKSTLLRAVGTNTVLALAGAPVRAARLRLSPLAVGATMRVRDSLQEGTSRFYAELVRLRDLVRIAEGPRPLLFLLDEILHGTNSHDRLLGAEAVVRGLVERGAIGLVTTHDLALARIADDPALGAVNVHFEDCLQDGQMTFDYRMRPGVVATSNALALMRALGLPAGSERAERQPGT